MLAQRLEIRFSFSQQLSDSTFLAAIPLFHRWIQQKAVPGLLLDVADYSHIPTDARLILMGHDVEYGLIQTDDATEFWHTRYFSRMAEQPSAEAAVAQLVAEGLASAEKIASDLGEIALNNYRLRFLDRLRVPNSAETLPQLLPILQTLGHVEQQPNDARAPFTILVTR